MLIYVQFITADGYTNGIDQHSGAMTGPPRVHYSQIAGLSHLHHSQTVGQSDSQASINIGGGGMSFRSRWN